jgi:hypothetical protein
LLAGCSPAEPASSSSDDAKIRIIFDIFVKKSPKFYLGGSSLAP